MKSQVTLVINVVDVNDNPPIFKKRKYQGFMNNDLTNLRNDLQVSTSMKYPEYLCGCAQHTHTLCGCAHSERGWCGRLLYRECAVSVRAGKYQQAQNIAVFDIKNFKCVL